MRRLLIASSLLLLLASLVAGPALRAQAPAPQPPVASVPPQAPDYRILEMLTKNAITAVNHANLTGNYTVVRDLGTEAFRRRNSAAELAHIFAMHREQRFDLSPILTSQPQFTQPPVEVRPGRLQLVGFFPTQPHAVRFAIAYEQSSVGWGIDEIALSIEPLAAILAPQPPTERNVPIVADQSAAHDANQVR